MKIGIATLDKLIGYGTAHGEEDVVWEGDIHNLKVIAQHWERQGYRGEELLRVMLKRLQSYTWAQEVPEGE